MIKNYWITALRTFRRNKVFTAINILGLSVGISAALVIYLLVQYDFSFEKFQPAGNRIYRVVTHIRFAHDIFRNSGIPYRVAEATPKEISGVEESAFFYTGALSRTTIPAAGGTPLSLHGQSGIVLADNHYFRLFPFYQWLAGSASELSQPFKVVLSASQAKTYFPDLTPTQMIGKTVIYDDSVICTVTGVVKDIQENSDLAFIKDFVSLPTITHTSGKQTTADDWSSLTSSSQFFVRLNPNTTPARVERQYKIMRDKYSNDKIDTTTKVTQLLQPLKDIHFAGDYDAFGQRQAHKPTLYGLLIVAAFLLILGSINFINLSTAQATQRAKEIGIRKTMGSSRHQLIIQFLSEAFLLTLASSLLSLALVPGLLKIFADFIPQGLHTDFWHQPGLLYFLSALVIVVSLLSGFYPAWILARFNPVLVLKNQAYTGTSSTRSAVLRKTLTVSQFVIAQIFVIAAFIVGRQIRYSLNMDMGFKKDAIVFFNTPFKDPNPTPKQAVLLDKLRKIPGIALISAGGQPPAIAGTWSYRMTYNDGKKEIETDVQLKNTDSNYMRLYGLRLLAGRPIIPTGDTSHELIINQTYARMLGFSDPAHAVGQPLSKGRFVIVGVMQDFHQASTHAAVKPLTLLTGGEDRTYIHVALERSADASSGWTTTLARIGSVYKEIYPQQDFEYHFVDDTVSRFYTAEQQIARLLNWATGLTIFISCLGLLGLVIYSTRLRVKEIGVRKVLGASATQIVSILSKDFVKLVGIAFIIAVPIAWWAVAKWLEGFVYRVPVAWWIFPVSGGAMILIAWLTLGIHTIRAANANPVKALRSE